MITYPRKLTSDVMLFGNRYFSVYLVRRGDSYTLIECGISSIAEQVIRQITSLGVDVSKIQELILTHGHADHITGAPVLKKALPWIRVKTTLETKALLSRKKIQTFFIKDDQDIHTRLLELDAVDRQGSDRISLEHVVDDIIAPARMLEGGGGQPIEVLDAPGHCKGGIALWQPESQVLFCSDYLGFHVPPDRFVPNFYVDYDDFMETFESLCGLKPQWICPGHCGAYRGEEAVRFMERARAEMKWVHDYVVDSCSASDKIETAKTALFERYYIGEATLFSKESTRICMDLLIRRILNSKAHASPQASKKG